MHLSYRIPLVTGIILVLTAIVNIGAFQFFSEYYFEDYVSELSTNISTPDPDELKTLLQIGKLSKRDQAEYFAILAELSNLTTSIENISNNPELYVATRGASGDMMISLPKPDTSENSVPFFSFSAFGQDSVEGRFVTNILQSLLVVNLVWLLFILVGYFIWIRSIFRPVDIITTTIQKIIDRKRYATIRYAENNEFSPLITTINNLHKSLSIQEKIRSEFLSDLSHEIRTPITAVRCYLEAIEDGMMKIDTDTIPLLQNELSRLTSITLKIMDFESFTHESFDVVQVEKFSAKKITEEIIQEYLPQFQKKSQTVRLGFPSDSSISMDKGMFVQILHNIFSNFIKYAGEDTELFISYKKSERESILEFSDNGKGIPDGEMPFVKEKFYRVDKSRNSADQSMGIGLSIIEKITRLHRGSLEIQKNSPKGVRVIVRIGR